MHTDRIWYTMRRSGKRVRARITFDPHKIGVVVGRAMRSARASATAVGGAIQVEIIDIEERNEVTNGSSGND